MSEISSEKTFAAFPFFRKSAGFTLIEILIAVVIVGLLSAISAPLYNGYIDRAKLTVSLSTLESVRRVIDDYYGYNQGFPPDINMTTGEDGLGKIVLDSAQLADFHKSLSLESYSSPSTTTYTLTARATDTKHTLLTLIPGQVIALGP